MRRHGLRGAPTVVLVHGMYHRGWCWAEVAHGLRAAGIRVLAPDIPRPQSPAEGDVGLARLLEALEEAGPTILCGHSAGGREITLAGDHSAVRALVYLAAMMPDAQESLAGFAREAVQPPSLLLSSLRLEAGRIVVDPRRAADLFYHDCPTDRAAWAIDQLNDEPMITGLPDTIGKAPWRTRPSTYVVCGQDRALAPEIQRRLASRAGESVEWPTGHSPFLSRPRLAIDLIQSLVRRHAD